MKYLSSAERNLNATRRCFRLSGMFYSKDICLSYDEYSELIKQTEQFQKAHENYTAEFTRTNAFQKSADIDSRGAVGDDIKGQRSGDSFCDSPPEAAKRD